ncbi:MAG TPA: metallophosphoesterase family protein [Tepiditoga sp.]|nr:metallophosphoesterase family protein [Tepiditoga sp.]
MKIAVISDIHSNREAFDAVLKDIESEKADKIFCVGDLIGYGPDPEYIISKIRDMNIPTVMGNYDNAVAFGMTDCGCSYNPGRETEVGNISLKWTSENISDEYKSFLKTLPYTISVNIENVKILFVHGSTLDNLFEYVRPETSPERLKELTENISEDIIVNGHTHISMARHTRGKTFLNPGSIGRTKEGFPKAVYMIIDIKDGVFSYEFIKIDYDYRKTIEKIVSVGLPNELATVIALGNTYKMGKTDTLKTFFI